MPTPSRTSLTEIVSAAAGIVESEGLDGLTMQKVASVVGVRAPSLYKHVSSRAELIKLIAEETVEELRMALESASRGSDHRVNLEAMARAFREFAHRRPESYRLVFAPTSDDWRPDPDVLVSAVRPVLETAGGLAGSDHGLEAARLVTAWAHGFVTMELGGAFRMEGDIDAAFSFGIERIGATLASKQHPAR